MKIRLIHFSLSLSLVAVDRVKVINGIQPPLTSENNNTNNNNINENDQIENIHLLNILNWSPLENLRTNKAIPSNNNDNESRSKNGYNAVQISIEIQKKMLK